MDQVKGGVLLDVVGAGEDMRATMETDREAEIRW